MTAAAASREHWAAHERPPSRYCTTICRPIEEAGPKGGYHCIMHPSWLSRQRKCVSASVWPATVPAGHSAGLLPSSQCRRIFNAGAARHTLEWLAELLRPVLGLGRRQAHDLAALWRQLPHDFPLQPPQHYLLQLTHTSVLTCVASQRKVMSCPSIKVKGMP